jgi:hypothetical protein
MKKLILPFLILFSAIVSAQKINKTEQATDHSIHVKGNDFEGAIFNKEYNSLWIKLKRNPGIIYSTDNTFYREDTLSGFTRFTPSTEDIELTECIIKEDLKRINKKLPSFKFVRGPNIYRHLKKYVRQYFGLINNKQEKIVFLNCFWDDREKNTVRDWLEDYYNVYDGGNYYWQGKVNLITHQLFDFGVHGAI